jgi:hypothetical protein
LQLYGTQSEGRRTPKVRRNHRSSSFYATGEKLLVKEVDSLYLKATYHTKIDHGYAQLKPTNKCISNNETKTYDKNEVKKLLLVVITENYSTNEIQVNKGDIVSVITCQTDTLNRLWYKVKGRDGIEGKIPASIVDEFL